MKTWNRFIIVSVLLIPLLASSAIAQGDFQEDLESMLGDNAKGYLQPFATAFGVNMNSGLYNTAKVHGMLGFDLSIKMMAAFIPEDADLYMATVPTNTIGVTTEVEAPTVFGPEDGESTPLYKLPGGLDWALVPFAVPQVSVGLIMGTEVNLRYLPTMEIPGAGDIGEIEFMGFGLSHDLKQWIPFPLPFFPNVSVGFMMQTFNVLDADGEPLIEATNTAFNLRVSKSVPLITVYFGAQFESSSLDVTYRYKNPLTGQSGAEQTFSLDGDNQMRVTGGLKFTFFPFMAVNADYSLGEYASASAGLTFSFR